jgi:GH35 family endo-1,4-beta-xylanase
MSACGELVPDREDSDGQSKDSDSGLPDAGDADAGDKTNWDTALTLGVEEIFTIDDFDDGDIDNETGGHWLSYDDGYDNGDSVIRPTSVFKGGVFESSAPGLGGSGFAAHITGTTGSKLGWDYLGFLASLDKDALCPLAAPTKIDMNSFDGIQFVVKGSISTGALVFKLPHKKSGAEGNCTAHDPVSADSLTGYADYEYNFMDQLSSEWTLVRIPFADMAQVDWTPDDAVVKMKDVLATAQELVFQVNASGAEADFWIDSVALFKYPRDPNDVYPKIVVSDINALALNDSKDDSATGTRLDIDVANQPFNKAVRVQTDAEPTHLWDVMLTAPNETAIPADDVLEADFYARCAAPPEGESECRMSFYFQSAAEPYTRSTIFPVRVGETWQRFSHPFRAAAAYDKGDAAAMLMFGYPAESVEVANFSIQNYGDTKQLDELNNTPFTYKGRESDAAWRQAADERIETLRKGDLSIRVEDKDGVPVQGAEVTVEMTRHRFGFGTAIDEDGLKNSMSENDAEKYTETVSELFNTVVFENTLKWPALVGEWGSELGMETALWGLDWADDLKLATRGHVLVWPGWKNLPASLKTDYDAAVLNDGLDAANELLKQTVADHVQSTVSSLSGRLDHWDVLNEPFDNHDLMDILGQDVMADWFKIARQADASAKLFINDYSIIAPMTTYSASRRNLITAVDYLLKNDAPLDGIGVQGHFQGDLTDPERVLEILDELSAFDKEIWITEFDITDADETLAADYLRDFLTVLFSHPAVQGFMMWGFWDGAHFGGAAPLFEKDWTEKPGHAAYNDLVFNKWWTNESGTTDADGRFAARGFFGDYTITVTMNDKQQTLTAEVTPESQDIVIVPE